MEQDDRDQGTQGGAGRCQSASELLKQVTREINEYEAKKLGELKADLDAFVKNQEKLDRILANQELILRNQKLILEK